MLPYRHTQIGWVTLSVLAVTALAVMGANELLKELLADSDVPWLIHGFIGLMAVFMVLFGSLTVEVDPERISIRFGPGLIRKRWDIAQVVVAEVMRTRVWHGWGIRLTPEGWLYNVSGFDAVRVTLANGKSRIIGTDEPEEFLKALHEAGVLTSEDAGVETA